MSNSGRMVFCRAVGVVPHPIEGVPALQVNYRYSEPYNGVTDGDIYVVLDGHTESEMSSIVQQAALDHCQAECEFTQDFVLSDVRGGRI